MRYLHHKSQEDEAELLADAFRAATGSAAAALAVVGAEQPCTGPAAAA
jgi:hypothetical protein